MTGLILRSTGSWHEVLGEGGERYPSRMRGRVRLEERKETNPVAVGDFVVFEVENNEGVIDTVLPRQNYLVRQSSRKAGHTHVIAANVDQAMLIISVSFPRTSLGFIDRFSVAAESFRIPQVFVFNKRDLWGAEEQETVRNWKDLYESLGVTCLITSALRDGQEPLEEILRGKKTLMAGHSGVGKSTLINRLSPGIDQKTSQVSGFTAKGKHTTAFAEMFRLDDDTFIIDTPGIKELGLVDMKPEELSDYFIEMRDVRLRCKFGARCLHLNEPHCAVLEAMENGHIRQSRYESYVTIVTARDTRK